MIQNTLTYISALIGSKIKNERGQAMVEYGLIIVLIAIVVIAAVTAIGLNLNEAFTQVKEKLPTPRS